MARVVELKDQIYDLLDNDQRIVQDITDYFVRQGFRLSAIYDVKPDHKELIYYLNSIYNIIIIEINTYSLKIKLTINNIDYTLKVNSSSFTDLIRIINNNLNKMKEKKESESN